MSQLLETIKCKDGKLFNLDFHQARFDNARKEYFKCSDEIILSELLQIPTKFKKGLFRCRISYSTSINKIEFLPHRYKKTESLKLVVDDGVDYQYKYSNRNKLNNLYEKRGDCDDILIIKNACITDSFTANPVFFDGKNGGHQTRRCYQGLNGLNYLRKEKYSNARLLLTIFRNIQKQAS